MKIDLGAFHSHNAKVYAGRDRGAAVRKAAKLDQLDTSEESVEVFVPPATISVNSSFFLGMFGPSIEKLGSAEFQRKYYFTGRDISRTVGNGILEVLRESSPLAGGSR